MSVSTTFISGGEIGDASILTPEPAKTFELLVSAIDEILPDGFEMWDLEDDESVYVSFHDQSEQIVAEVRYTTPQENGFSEAGMGPCYAVVFTKEGPEPDSLTTWFNLDEAIDFVQKTIKQFLRV